MEEKSSPDPIYLSRIFRGLTENSRGDVSMALHQLADLVSNGDVAGIGLTFEMQDSTMFVGFSKMKISPTLHWGAVCLQENIHNGLKALLMAGKKSLLVPK